MVLGLRTKSKKIALVQVDYTVSIQEIKPWPLSLSLKSLRSIVIQWENGDRNSGSTNPVVPSPGDGKIEFNESFKLHVSLAKDAPVKGNDTGTFHKNLLELNLYEPRNKSIKGRHIGSAVIDLAEHGIIKEAVDISIPVSCKRSYKNTSQPVLFIRIQPFEKDGSNSSSKKSLSKEVSLEKDGKESVSELMSEEYAEEAELASFTDDDETSYSSLANSTTFSEANSSSPQKDPDQQLHFENGSEGDSKRSEISYVEADFHLESVPEKSELTTYQNGSSSLSSSTDLCSDEGDSSLTESRAKGIKLIPEISDNHSSHSSLSSVNFESSEENFVPAESATPNDNSSKNYEKFVDCQLESAKESDHPVKIEDLNNDIASRTESFGSSDLAPQMEEGMSNATSAKFESSDCDVATKIRNGSEEAANCEGIPHLLEKKCEESQLADGDGKIEEVQSHSDEVRSSDDPPDKLSPVSVSSMEHHAFNQQCKVLPSALRKPAISDSPTFCRRLLSRRGTSDFTFERLKNAKSVRLAPETVGNVSPRSIGLFTEDIKEVDILEAVCDSGEHFGKGISDKECTSLRSGKAKRVSLNMQNGFSKDKIHALELRVEMLERELIEAAAIEIALYSIVAEHGSSAHKVHTPARRLSRLYIHASKKWSCQRAASAGRSCVSGLVLAAKACGNDIPRLTFWLSNSVLLRTIISLSAEGSELLASSGPQGDENGTDMSSKRNLSSLKWESSDRARKISLTEDFDNWEDPKTVTNALEKVEAWIFSRIAESIWWQTLTLHTQSVNDDWKSKVNLHQKKSCGRNPSLNNRQQAHVSIDLWKKAFKEARERLCPVRAAGHECGCLPMLATLVMEQCMARLDVAMFNAILRESADDIPTDPVSDPISDWTVLPVPSGKTSFGAGAQLKNAIGNWSRSLSDMFGIDDECPEDEEDDGRKDVSASVKSLRTFHLLNALSDLLMLPKDMLLESSIRKEVCPLFSGPVIKQILNSFGPDEFCPDMIPVAVLEALDAEDPLEGSEVIRNFPCNASPIIYSPPSVTSIVSVIGDAQSKSLLQKSGSSVTRKSHLSDDELDELDSPLTSLAIFKSFTTEAKSQEKKVATMMRYQLLQEVWRDED